MPDFESPPFVIGAILLVVLILLVVGTAFRRTSHRKAETLLVAYELGTARIVGFFGSATEGLYRGYTCRYTIEQASQYSPGGASLRIAVTSPFPWSAGVVDFGSRLMLRLGILKDIEVGDAELDEKLRFAGRDADGLRGLLGQPRVQARLRELVRSDNFQQLNVAEGRTTVKWVPRQAAIDESPDHLRLRLEAVAVLFEACGYPPRMG